MLNAKKHALKVLGAVSLVVLLMGCTPQQEDAVKYLQEGKALFEKGNLEQARIQFKNALQINPKLAEAYYQLALLDEKSQNWESMYGNLFEAARLDAKHVEAHLKLGQFYLAGRALDKAAQEAALVKQLRPDHVGALTLQGAIFYAQGKKLEGFETVRRALEKEPTHFDAITLQASLYLSEGQYTEALSVLKRGIEAYPQDFSLPLLKIRAEVESKDYDAAVNDYHALIAKHPDKKELTYGLAGLLSRIGRQEQAEAVLRGFIDKNPAEINAKLTLIDYLTKWDMAEAESTLKQFAEENPKEILLQSSLAEFYVIQKRYTDAQSVLNHIIELDKSGRRSIAAQVELAKIALLQNDAKTAESFIEAALAQDSKNPEALLFRAAMRLDRKETDAAIADLRIVVSSNPLLDQPLVLLARAYQQNGDAELADSYYRKALEINPGNLSAALTVADKMIKSKEFDRAEAVLKTVRKTYPGDIAAVKMLIQVRVLKKDWNGAQALAAELGQQPNGTAAGHFLSGEVFANQGCYDEAIKQFQQALLEKPDFTEAIRDLAQAYRAAGKKTQLVAHLKTFIEKNPSAVEAYNTLGLFYGSEKQWDDAVKVLQMALRVDPKSSAAYQALANVYLARKKTSEVVEIYRKGLAELPDNIPLMVMLAQHYERVKDINSAITLYSKIIEKEPNNDVAVNNLATLLVDYRTDKESLQQATKLVARYASSSNPNLLDTYAWAALKSGEKDKALPVLKGVVAAAPEVAIYRYHLGVAYHQTSDTAAAKKELQGALALAEKQGEFVGVDHARNLVTKLSVKPASVKSP